MSNKIIDTHVHFYPDAIAERAVDALGTFYDFVLRLQMSADSLFFRLQRLLTRLKELTILYQVVSKAQGNKALMLTDLPQCIRTILMSRRKSKDV